MSNNIDHEAGLAMCTGTCSGAGHSLHPIQRVVVSGAPSSWVDGFVAHDGDRVVVTTLTGDAHVLWHHASLRFVDGEPVAFHPVAGVLAVGGALVSVREF